MTFTQEAVHSAIKGLVFPIWQMGLRFDIDDVHPVVKKIGWYLDHIACLGTCDTDYLLL